MTEFEVLYLAKFDEFLAILNLIQIGFIYFFGIYLFLFVLSILWKR